MAKASIRPTFLENSCIIVCHPDDEILWFGSIVKEVDEIVIAYEDFWAQPKIGAARAKALSEFPRQVTSLHLAEAGTYGFADWATPEIDDYGISFMPATRGVSEVKRRTKQVLGSIAGIEQRVSAESIKRRYVENHSILLQQLRPRLKPSMNVFTHNPWGEYGHEDHVQMFRVLDELRKEIGFKLWMSNYCTDRSLPLAKRYFQRKPDPAICLPVDKDFCESVAKIYKDAGCWTWHDDWAWFEHEYFQEAPSRVTASEPQRHLFPLNLFSIESDASNLGLIKTAGLSAAGFGIALVLTEIV